jgi:hypothetical protein
VHFVATSHRATWRTSTSATASAPTHAHGRAVTAASADVERSINTAVAGELFAVSLMFACRSDQQTVSVRAEGVAADRSVQRRPFCDGLSVLTCSTPLSAAGAARFAAGNLEASPLRRRARLGEFREGSHRGSTV